MHTYLLLCSAVPLVLAVQTINVWYSCRIKHSWLAHWHRWSAHWCQQLRTRSISASWYTQILSYTVDFSCVQTLRMPWTSRKVSQRCYSLTEIDERRVHNPWVRSNSVQVHMKSTVLPPEATTVEHGCKSVNASPLIALANIHSSEVQPTMSGL